MLKHGNMKNTFFAVVPTKGNGRRDLMYLKFYKLHSTFYSEYL